MQATKHTLNSPHSWLRHALLGALTIVALVLPSLRASHSPLPAPNAQALGNSGAPPRSQYFAATGKVVQGHFLSAFEQYGLERIGYPLSDERAENGRTVQYFERVRMEYHPDLASKGYSILLTRLGADLAGNGFARVAPFKSTSTKAYIAETGHSLSEPFLSYWRSNGSVAFFGYPISEPMQQDGLYVQWFERARMEYHPNLAKQGKGVQLTHLGRTSYERVLAPAVQAPKASEPTLSDRESFLYKSINDQRAAAGLGKVQLDAAMTDLGRARSADMAQRNYFSHTTPDGTKFLDMLTLRGIAFRYAGEILARNNYPTAEAAQTAMQSYLTSAPHKAVMLSGRYNYVGIGHALSSEDEMHYFTVIFVER